MAKKGATMMSAEDVKGEDVTLFENITRLSTVEIRRGSPNIEVVSTPVNYDLTSLESADYKDRVAYRIADKWSDETKALEEMATLLQHGREFISLLYSYRSASKTLPLVQQDTSAEARIEIYQKTFAILRPEILKLRRLMDFQYHGVHTVVNNIQNLVADEVRGQQQSDDLLDAIIHCIDMLIILDSVKDAKACILNDFSRYKRAFSPIKNDLPEGAEIEQEIMNLRMFYANPNQGKFIIAHNLRQNIQKHNHYDAVVIALLEHCANSIEQQRYMKPNEEHAFYRVIPYLMYFLDSKDKEKRSINAFRHKKLKLGRLQKLAKKMPVIPLEYDMKMSVVSILQQCTNWDTKTMEHLWTSSERQKKDVYNKQYALTMARANFRNVYNEVTVQLSQCLNQVKWCRARKQATPTDTLYKTFDVVRDCLRALSDMAGHISRQAAWKFDQPCDMKTYQMNGGQDGPASAYEMATKFNYSGEELYALIDVIGLIKGLGGLLLKNEIVLVPLLRRAVHDMFQVFLQKEVARPLRKAFKRNRTEVMACMLQMRDIGGDWFNPQTMKEDYKSEKRKILKMTRDFPRRSTAPSLTQIVLVRRMMHRIWTPKSETMTSGFFKQPDLKKEWIPIWKEFYTRSLYFKYFLDFGTTLREITDLSFLWYREFYLEITRQVQFPIAMSMPWILTDFLIRTPSMKENIFFPMDIYNDAGARALTTLKQQFLYDEIEAECNLSFDQLVFHLSEDVFKYFKTLASRILIDKQYEKAFLKEKNKAQFDVTHSRYAALMQQRHITLLGRTIDLNLLISQQINGYLRQNINYAIRRYEASDLTSIVGLKLALDNVRVTHALLKDLLTIDPWEKMLKEINEDVSIGVFRGRILWHSFSEIVTDLVPNYVFNGSTNRYIRGPVLYSDEVTRERPPSNVQSWFWYGNKYREPFERRAEVCQGYFGVEHMEALIQVLDITDVPLIIHEAVSDIANKTLYDFSPYATALSKALPPLKLPNLFYGVQGAFGALEIRLSKISSYGQLRSGVFQLLREIGNTIRFVKMLESTLLRLGDFDFQSQAFFTGIRPVPAKPAGDKSGSKDSDIPEVPFILHQGHNPVSLIVGQTVQVLEAMGDKEAGIMAHLKRAGEIAPTLYTYDSAYTSMLTASLDRLTKVLRDNNVAEEWKGNPPKEGDILNVDAPNDIIRLWSFMLFIFNQKPQMKEGDPDSRFDDMTIFGEGFLWAGCLLIHLMGYRARFEFMDFNYHILKLMALKPLPKEEDEKRKKKKKGAAPTLDEIMVPKAREYIKQVTKIKAINEGIFASLSTYLVAPTHQPFKLHPPKDYKEFVPVRRLSLRGSSADKQAAKAAASQAPAKDASGHMMPPTAAAPASRGPPQGPPPQEISIPTGAPAAPEAHAAPPPAPSPRPGPPPAPSPRGAPPPAPSPRPGPPPRPDAPGGDDEELGAPPPAPGAPPPPPMA